MADSGVKSVKNDAVSARAKQRKDDPPIDSKELPKASKAKLKKEDQNPEKQMANWPKYECKGGYSDKYPELKVYPDVIKAPPHSLGLHLERLFTRIEWNLFHCIRNNKSTHLNDLLHCL